MKTMNKLSLMILSSLIAGHAMAVDGESEHSVSKQMNFRTDALLWAGGNINLEADWKVSPSFTVGPIIGQRGAEVLFVQYGGWLGGVRGNWYVTGPALDDGLVISPQIGLMALNAKFLDYEASQTSLYTSTMVSYQFVMDSGFNLNVGGGANYYFHSEEMESKNKEFSFLNSVYSGMTPTLEVTVGYAI